MATATTTVKEIIAQMETTLRALTPLVLSTEKYQIARGERGFEDWAELNPSAALRRYQVRDVGEYEAPLISNTDLEQVITTLELVMAYPFMYGQYHTDSSAPPGNIQDLEDAARSDMHQIRNALGINGSANYASGQLSSKESGAEFEDGDAVLFVRMPFEVIFYRDMNILAVGTSAFTSGFSVGFA